MKQRVVHPNAPSPTSLRTRLSTRTRLVEMHSPAGHYCFKDAVRRRTRCAEGPAKRSGFTADETSPITVAATYCFQTSYISSRTAPSDWPAGRLSSQTLRAARGCQVKLGVSAEEVQAAPTQSAAAAITATMAMMTVLRAARPTWAADVAPPLCKDENVRGQ